MKGILLCGLSLLGSGCAHPAATDGGAGGAAPDGPSPDVLSAPPLWTERVDLAAEAMLSPRERDRLGDEYLFVARPHEAIRNFDAFLAAEPAFGPQHWRRGIALYYAERFGEGADQFVRHRAVNPDDVENAAWHFLCIARVESVGHARASLLPVGPDQRDPMHEIYELMAGRATPDDVLENAASSSQHDAVFFAHLYLGLYFEALGETSKARKHIELAATTHGRSHYMGRVAKMHASLTAAPAPDTPLAHSLADAVLRCALTNSGTRADLRDYGGNDPSTRVILLVSEGLPDGYRPVMRGFNIRLVPRADLPGQLLDPLYARDEFTYVGMQVVKEGEAWGPATDTVYVVVWTVAASRAAKSVMMGSTTCTFKVVWEGDVPAVSYHGSQSI